MMPLPTGRPERRPVGKGLSHDTGPCLAGYKGLDIPAIVEKADVLGPRLIERGDVVDQFCAIGRRRKGGTADLAAVFPFLDAARNGQAWALTEIWTSHAPAVAGYLRGRGASEPDDLTSEVFLAVFERLPSFPGASLRRWVRSGRRHSLFC